MKTLQQFDHIYLIGIGGIGMSALARYFKFTGKQVGGYDKLILPSLKNLLKRELLFTLRISELKSQNNLPIQIPP